MITTAKDFRKKLNEIIGDATDKNLPYVDVWSKDLHRQVGEYPGPNHRMPMCCYVMKEKLRLWLLIFGVGVSIAAILLNYALFGMDHFDWDNKIKPWDPDTMYFHITITIVILVSAVYVIRRWSISWNEKVS